MTSNELSNFINDISYHFVTKVCELSNIIRTGSAYDDKLIECSLLRMYLNLVRTYSVGSNSINYLTPSDMLDIQFRINRICGTNYNYDFELQTI